VLALGATVERRVAELPRRQRSVLGLRIWSDLSFKEIGRLLGTSENSAKVNYHHAIRKLKQLLSEEDS
jgi:RNA polymerase sigma-70 factor (ECF subfamily)